MSEPHLNFHFSNTPSAETSSYSINNRHKRLSRGLDLPTKKKRHDYSVGKLSIDASARDITAHINLWANVSFSENVRNERKRSLRAVKEWIQDPTTLKLHWNALPNIFHTHYVQNRLTKLFVQCPKGYIKNGNLLDLPELLGNLSHLKELKVSGVGLRVVSDSLSSLTDLEKLRLDNTAEEYLPESIFHLRNLKTLILYKNSRLEQLPASLTRLPHLRMLSIHECIHFMRLPDSAADSFGNLKSLSRLIITDCPRISHLPPSIHETGIEYLTVDFCRSMEELPDSTGLLRDLRHLSLTNTPITNLPISLYKLALNGPEGLLPDQWNTHVAWMREACANALPENEAAYQRNNHTICIKIYSETLIPYAQEHLGLLTSSLLNNPNVIVKNSDVKYLGQQGIDAGALSRDFWSRIISSIAEQMKREEHPLLKELPNGQFQLALDMPRQLTESEKTLCANIGKLFTAFLLGLSKREALGSFFPLYFYAGIIDLNTRYFYDRKKSVHEVCYSMARADDQGIQIEGDFLFNLPQNLSEIEIWTDEELRRVWKLLNLAEPLETIRVYFPSLHRFFDDLDGFDDSIDTSGYHVLSNLESADFAEFTTLFRKSLLQPQIKLIEATLLKQAYVYYHLRYPPLAEVARHFTGFYREPFGDHRERLTDCLTPFLLLTQEESLIEKAKKLSIELQGDPFTPEAFHALIQRCRANQINPIPPNIIPILHWYQTEATEEQMKTLIRCFTGNELISSNMVLIFNNPALIGSEAHFRPSPLSVFHACGRSVNVGYEIMSHKIKTERDKKALIALWQNHVNWALSSGFVER